MYNLLYSLPGTSSSNNHIINFGCTRYKCYACALNIFVHSDSNCVSLISVWIRKKKKCAIKRNKSRGIFNVTVSCWNDVRNPFIGPYLRWWCYPIFFYPTRNHNSARGNFRWLRDPTYWDIQFKLSWFLFLLENEGNFSGLF